MNHKKAVILILVTINFIKSRQICQDKLAVITSSFGSYDSPTDVIYTDISGCVDYFYFTDNFLGNTEVNSSNFTYITEPYHMLDEEIQTV